MLRSGAGLPADTVCFHAQQCVEKYLKALLALRGIAFPKTHNLRALMGLVPRNDQPQFSEDEQDVLTDYATGARYPGWGDVPPREAREAVKLARRIRREIRRLFPKEALPRRKR
ncbi:MAG: hypothetical protein A3J27_13465 [Candidatus Tectomicrobia bacterium RIFCSPLOWO2_12_FULL_69_37]|nr:MAG: hypothetical protein A3J27_13465 [Candidatus Tectomicrobia bacterium RIFCSPLOWO2_12_FULL_69_37]OGL65462.1 MAG: hypothetical protein A3I72_03235 [Candidatus Tectomicrobia bacterium RIFCSPLOWO2_02_FULL_70_19]